MIWWDWDVGGAPLLSVNGSAPGDLGTRAKKVLHYMRHKPNATSSSNLSQNCLPPS